MFRLPIRISITIAESPFLFNNVLSGSMRLDSDSVDQDNIMVPESAGLVPVVTAKVLPTAPVTGIRRNDYQLFLSPNPILLQISEIRSPGQTVYDCLGRMYFGSLAHSPKPAEGTSGEAWIVAAPRSTVSIYVYPETIKPASSGRSQARFFQIYNPSQISQQGHSKAVQERCLLSIGNRPGHQMGTGHIYENMISRSTGMKPQITCPPIGQTSFSKRLHGMNSYASPFFHTRNGFHTIHSENSPVKPRIVTVVKPGNHPLKKITLLLNRRSVQTFEQLIADISEALGFPRWKNDRVRKLYNLKGKEIRSVSDFFRGDDIFIALGKTPLTLKCIEIVLSELFPDKPLKLNTDCCDISKCKINAKEGALDSSYKDTDLAKCKNILSPRLAEKHEGKTHMKQKTGDSRKNKKHEKINSDNLTGKIKKLDICYCKPNTMLTASVDCVVLCEQCKSCDFEHRLYTDLENNTSTVEELLKNKYRNQPMCSCIEEKSKQKCKNCHHVYKGWKRDGNQKEIVDSSMDVPNKLYCPHSLMLNINHRTQKNECFRKKCQRDRNTLGEEHSSSLIVKHSGRFIEDFLEDTMENIQIKDDSTVADNKTNSKKDSKGNIDSTKQKEDGGFSRRENGKALYGIKRPCVKHYLDIEKTYEIGRTIGDGNFAVVKECRLRTTSQEYAMKIIDKTKLIGKEDIVQNEVRIIKMLSHPNIVKLIDDFETENEIYLILEYIKGGDLFDVISQSIKFTEHNAALMLTDLCQALVYIHSKKIAHRDLKPENLLVQQNPDGSASLKLADFGLAVHVTEPIFTVCGTPTYVAPEILSEKGYGLEVDMWATGVILYILLCGFPPFRSPERNHEELFQIIQHGEYEFLSPYWDKVSDEAKDLISRLLVVSPGKRFTAQCVLQHSWVRSSGQMNSHNLQREVTINIERHFRSRPQNSTSNDP
ncbi:serine/threonine-protein kinase DCLK3 [Gastrophryne carolinensis]